MRREPTALGHIDDEVTIAPEWDKAVCIRLARQLGYRLIWPPEYTRLTILDLVRETDVDAVITPSATHVDALTLDRLMHTCDVETACPRETFARYFGGRRGCPA
ncbi:hypothetical protein D7D52_27005 [Nocardia yunnanensis]|uniref:Uncharacterized protein n=1 Tax=Nocardia yunnanensis TaxID=2382165 RepID=A0A386ZI23_9NOCA|nr:hypothetical protein [Nocardia yunnanensis]AYF76853.1 hypothetical protein D7D52_27005 [Nocardia yunnanensis]